MMLDTSKFPIHKMGNYRAVEVAGGVGDFMIYHYTDSWGHDRHPNIVVIIRGKFTRTRIDNPSLVDSMLPGMTNGAWEFKKGEYKMEALEPNSMFYCISKLGGGVPVHERVILKNRSFILRMGSSAVVARGGVATHDQAFGSGEIIVAKTDAFQLSGLDAELEVFH